MKNVNFEDVKNALVEVFESEELTAQYQEPSIMSECFGWAGVMSPLTRLAYVQEFGEDIVTVAENAAREQIAQKEEQRSRTQFAQHAKEADNLTGAPSEGSYFWCDNSGLKCDDGNGVFGEIEALVRYKNEKPTKRLCYAEQVFCVTEEEFNNKHLANELVEKHNLQGYCNSDDVEENDDFYNDLEKLATFYTVGALVVSPSGRWYLIDTEGYNYPRYIYVPMDWRTMYDDEVKRIEEEEQRKHDEEQKQQEEHERAMFEKYSYLTDLSDIKDYKEEYNAMKSNVIAVLKHNIPGVYVSFKKSSAYGYYDVTLGQGADYDKAKELVSIFERREYDYNYCYEPLTKFHRHFGSAKAIFIDIDETKPQKTAQTRKPAQPSDTQKQSQSKPAEMKIIDYSDRAIAVVGLGALKHIAELKRLGGGYNSHLTCGKGWIFPKSKREAVAKAFNL